MSARKTHDEKMEDIDRMIEQLRERRRQEVARHSVEARKAEAHARHVFGSLVLECVGGEWTAVDPARLEAVLAGNADVLARCAGEPLPLEAARSRMREWEASRRERERSEAASEPVGEATEVAYEGGDL
jgi:hypothetical protein